MRVLLVGGSGSLGSDLKPALVESHEVFAPPHGAAGIDLTSLDSIRRAVDATRPDVVINAAALANVDKCEEEPERAWMVNADGVRWLASVCGERGILLVQVSTDYVFDGAKGAPYLESDTPRPIQVYGKSKLQGERNALEVAGRALVVRTSWLFSRTGKNFANHVLAAARGGGEIKAATDWFGSPTSTVDLAHAITALIAKGTTGVVHVVNPGVQSRFEQAGEILALCGKNGALLQAVEKIATRAPRPRFTALASERLASLGVAMRSHAEAVREFVAGYTPAA